MLRCSISFMLGIKSEEYSQVWRAWKIDRRLHAVLQYQIIVLKSQERQRVSISSCQNLCLKIRRARTASRRAFGSWMRSFSKILLNRAVLCALRWEKSRHDATQAETNSAHSFIFSLIGGTSKKGWKQRLKPPSLISIYGADIICSCYLYFLPLFSKLLMRQTSMVLDIFSCTYMPWPSMAPILTCLVHIVLPMDKNTLLT